MTTIAIPAFTVFPGGGLMHFLMQSVRALASCQPNWKIVLIGSVGLENLRENFPDNVQIKYIDDDRLSRAIYNTTRWLLLPTGKKHDTGFLLQSRFEHSHLKWGNFSVFLELLKDADVIWVPHYSIVLDQLALYPLLKGSLKPTLFTIHDIHPAFYPEDHSPENLKRFYHGFVPFAKQASTIITHSQFQSKAIQHHLQIPSQRIQITPQPPLIDPTQLLLARNNHSPQTTLQTFGILSPYVFYPASTTHIHKNHTRLLASWSLIKQQLGEHCPLLVCTGIGSSRQWKNLQALIKAFDIQDKVVFTGPVNLSTLAVLYQGCQFVILPTLYEGAGSGILTDAYMMGKNILCSPIPQIQEQLTILKNAQIRYMMSDSVPAIVDAVLSQLENNKDQSETQTSGPAERFEEFQHLWQIWAQFYAEKIEQIQ